MELHMSPLTIFLGKLIGLYCIIVALGLMANKQRSVETVAALIRNAPLLLFVEVVALIAGLAMGAQCLVGGSLAGHRHANRVAGGDPRRRAALRTA
jgi:ABC-type amino acid transport system permease subunit